MVKRTATLALSTIFILAMGCPKSARPQTYPVINVTDGDTIRIMFNGKEEPVRLLNINTPEAGRRGYEEATRALMDLVIGRAVVIEFEESYEDGMAITEERDEYGRLLCYVFIDGLNVNVQMVKLGHSKFYTKYGAGKYAREFLDAEEVARARKRGLWARE